MVYFATSMLEIINGSVNFEEISESARKRITRAQRHGAATSCVPVDVEIRGGSYIPVTDRDNLRPWDTIGKFRFSLFISKGLRGVVEEVVRYNLTGDGRIRRLRAIEVGVEVSKIKSDDIRGVDAKVTQLDGIEGDILSFVAVPEPGQWRRIEGFDDKFPGADRPRTVINSMDNPITIFTTSRSYLLIPNMFCV